MKRQPTTQQVSWFLDLDRNKQLDLNPPYQRKSVWTPKDKKFFIDTVLKNYPAPPVFIHRTIDDNGIPTYHVVDGKQRLEAILAFAKNKLALAKDFGDTNVDGKKFNDIDIVYKRKFWDYILVVDFLEEVDGTSIDQVFDRVNRNSRNLQQQELRHARYNGWFISEAERFSEDKFWYDIRVSTKAKEKRMKSTQLISELMSVVIDKKYVGFNQDYLDEIYATYDDLEETSPDFDEEEYNDKRDTIVANLKAMEAANGCVSTYSRTANNLYTLWSVLALTPNLPDAVELATRYQNFMEKVQQYQEGDSNAEKSVEIYAQESKGASTDYQHRHERFTALQGVLL
ncbi:hypothetical protein A0257_09060 [Hymenobacter psoromatis]|nr:hypothetical protein A0257_09060 [Hymenobacter psoromatis]